VAKKKLAFNKYPLICELEARHGVDIGATYVNENAGKTFCANIAESRRKACVKWSILPNSIQSLWTAQLMWQMLTMKFS